MKKQILVCLILSILILVNMLNVVSAVSIKDVSSSPSEVAPGNIVDVSVKVENIFDYDVENLNLALDLSEAPFAPYQSSSEKFIDVLDSGEDEIFKFKLIVMPGASSGIYKIPVEISYSYNGTKSKSDLISLIVNSEPELKVSVEDSSVLIKGKEDTLSIRVTNSGLSDIKFVYVSIPDISGMKVLSDREQYIGDINSDDFNSVEYKVSLSESSPSSINLPVSLKFKDATNKDFTETETLTLKTYSLKEAQQLGLVSKTNYLVYIIIVILILGYIIYRVIRKARKKSKKWKIIFFLRSTILEEEN